MGGLLHELMLREEFLKVPFLDHCFFFICVKDLTSELHSDLVRIKQWTFQWKVSFNPDP